jgi:hypothetical protein
MDDSSRHEKKQWQAHQRASARAALPLSNADLEAMFDELDDRLEEAPCDHTLRFTTGWLNSRGFATTAVVAWLRDNGGYCDCEAAANVRDHWEQTLSDGSSRVKLDVELLPAARGGRSIGVSLRESRWRPHLRVFPSSELLGVTFVSGPAELAPGARCEAIALLVYTETGVDYSALQPGIAADILEGETVVGSARVIARLDR